MLRGELDASAFRAGASDETCITERRAAPRRILPAADIRGRARAI